MPTTQFTSVNTGSDANAGDGSTIRAAFTIINENTAKLNNQLNGTRTQSATYPVTYITSNNDISANSGTVYGQTIEAPDIYVRLTDGSKVPVLTALSGDWQGGTVSLYGIFANSDPSTSTTTGALQVVGGAGIGGNLFVGGLVSIAGNLTAGNLNISSGLTVSSLAVATTAQFIGNIIAANLTASGTLQTTGNASISGNLTAGNVISNLYGTVQTGAQTNITSLGTLTALTVSGNTVVNNTVYGRGLYDNGIRAVSTSSGAGNLTISGNSISLPSTGPGAGTYGSSTVVPVITTDAYGRIVSIGTGNISAISTTITLAGTSGSGSVAGGGTLTFASGNGVGITISSSTATINTAQDLQTAASPTFAGITLPSISKNGTTGTGNIGSSANAFNTVFAKATTAQYADLAEKYQSDSDYEPGTVLVFGTDTEVTISTVHEDNRVAGVVTTNPAYLMNSEAEGVAVALQGRVPCKVTGTIRRGDMMVTSNVPGVATACMPPFGPHIGTVIGKALQNYDSNEVGVIEIVVGRV